MRRKRSISLEIVPTQFSIPVVLAAAAMPVIMLLVANSGSTPPLIFGCLLLLFAVAVGWGKLVEAPSTFSTAFVILIIGIINLMLLDYSGDYAWSLVSVTLALPVSFLAEIIRNRPLRKTVWSISTMITGCIIGICANSWILIATYPIMRILTWAILPATSIAILVLAIPLKNPFLRLLLCTSVSIITNIIVTYLYLSDFPELGVVLPVLCPHKTLTTWILALLLAIFIGAIVMATTSLFILPPHSGQDLLKFTLLLFPIIFSTFPIYALARIIGG